MNEPQKTAQNVQNEDLISRRKAIDALDSLHYNDREDWCFVLDTIEYLPSAQPEIIFCKECKWSSNEPYHGEDVWICNRTHWARSEGQRNPEDFCSRAERR